MNKMHVLVVLLGLSQVVSADEGRRVDISKRARADGYVRIEVTRGNLQVVGWEKAEVRVSGLLDEQVEEFVFEVVDDETEIAVKLPRHLRGWRSNGSDLLVNVPRSSTLSIGVVSTDVEVDDIKGGLKISGVSGEITVSDIEGRTALSTVSGDVMLKNASGKVRITTVSGEIHGVKIGGAGSFSTVSGSILVDGVGLEVDAESVSGDIEISVDEVIEFLINSVSGDIEITTSLMVDGVIDIETVSGSVEIRLPRDTNARFDLESGSGGRIRNRLTDDEARVSKYSRDRRLRFVLVEGKGEVIARTASGRITLGTR